MTTVTETRHSGDQRSGCLKMGSDPIFPIFRGRSKTPSPGGQRGLALIAVLLLVLVSLGVALLTASKSRIELRIAHNDILEKRALAIAEAGVHQARKFISDHDQLNDELADASPGTCSGGGTSSSGIARINASVIKRPNDPSDPYCYRFGSFGRVAGDGASTTVGYYVRVEDNHDEPIGNTDLQNRDRDSVVRIVSHGVVGNADRTVVVALTTVPTMRVLATGPGGITLGGTSQMDSYAGVPPTSYASEAEIQSNGPINLLGGSQILGDAHAVGGVSGSGVSGTQTTETAPYSVPPAPVTPSAFPSPWAASDGIYNQNGGIVTLGPKSGGYRYSSLNISGGGKLRLGSTTSSDITILYVSGDWILTGSADLEVLSNTIIIIGGHWDTTGGTITNPGGNPNALTVVSTYASTAANDYGVAIGGGSNTIMNIYAPSSNFRLTGGTEYFGGLIAKTIELQGGGGSSPTKVHQYNPTAGLGVATGWREIQN